MQHKENSGKTQGNIILVGTWPLCQAFVLSNGLMLDLFSTLKKCGYPLMGRNLVSPPPWAKLLN